MFAACMARMLLGVLVLATACLPSNREKDGGSGGANAGGSSGSGGKSGVGGTSGSGGEAGGSGGVNRTGGAGGSLASATTASGGVGGSASGGAGGAASGEASGSGGVTDAAARGLPVSFVTVPTFTANDNPAAPLAGILRLSTDVKAGVSVQVSGGDEEWTLELPPDTSFTKPILGLKPATSYSLSLTVSAGDNVLAAGPLTWTTPPLPANFIPIQVPVSNPSRMEPGMTMFAVRDGWMMAQAPIIIVDAK